MRITGGTLSGRKLHPPTGNQTRPMRDAVRMAMFNILGRRVENCRFLDLFAGTGSVGIEALSRQAANATFVEQLPAALRTLEKNLQTLGLLENSRVLAGDVFRVLNSLKLGDPFDLIFVGPPYGKKLADQTLQALAETAILSPDGLIIAEVFRKEVLAPRYETLIQIDERRYGDNLIVIYRRAADDPLR